MDKKPKPFTEHEVYFGTFLVLMGLVGITWKLFLDFPSALVLLAGVFILLNEGYHRLSRRGLEYYFPAVHNILFKESLFDLAFNQNHITRMIRMMSRFITLVVVRDLSDESTKELLDGIDDTFIHRLFSPGLLSMVSPSIERSCFPIDRDVAFSIIQERRINPFKRPDMPYPFGVTAKRLIAPYVAGSVQTASLAVSGIMYKVYHKDPYMSLIPASTGTVLSLLMLLRKKLEKRPFFVKHYPRFPFKSVMSGIDPLTVAIICKYRKFYH
jgi:hypothetical protein